MRVKSSIVYFTTAVVLVSTPAVDIIRLLVTKFVHFSVLVGGVSVARHHTWLTHADWFI